MGFACPGSLESMSKAQRPGGLVSMGWGQSSWVQDVQGRPLKEAVAQETQGTVPVHCREPGDHPEWGQSLPHSHTPDKGGG